MNTTLKKLMETANFEAIFKKRNWPYFTNGSYNTNIIVVRNLIGSNYDPVKHRLKQTDTFDDALALIYKDSDGKWMREIFEVTSDPGLYALQNPLPGTIGTGCIAEGFYRNSWVVGKHKNQYTALVQRSAATSSSMPLTLYRDSNKDEYIDFNSPKQTGYGFGVNIHKAGVDSSIVKNWSYACIVFKRESDFNRFMKIIQKAKDLYGNSFSAAVLNTFDLENPEDT